MALGACREPNVELAGHVLELELVVVGFVASVMEVVELAVEAYVFVASVDVAVVVERVLVVAIVVIVAYVVFAVFAVMIGAVGIALGWALNNRVH